jgi:hypothetical protein
VSVCRILAAYFWLKDTWEDFQSEMYNESAMGCLYAKTSVYVNRDNIAAFHVPGLIEGEDIDVIQEADHVEEDETQFQILYVVDPRNPKFNKTGCEIFLPPHLLPPGTKSRYFKIEPLPLGNLYDLVHSYLLVWRGMHVALLGEQVKSTCERMVQEKKTTTESQDVWTKTEAIRRLRHAEVKEEYVNGVLSSRTTVSKTVSLSSSTKSIIRLEEQLVLFFLFLFVYFLLFVVCVDNFFFVYSIFFVSVLTF